MDVRLRVKIGLVWCEVEGEDGPWELRMAGVNQDPERRVVRLGRCVFW